MFASRVTAVPHQSESCAGPVVLADGETGAGATGAAVPAQALPDEPDGGLTITQAAQVTGVTADTLRYYERAGLMLARVPRSSARHRRYTAAEVRWIGTLTALRRTGMPIRRIAEYAALVRAGGGNKVERLALLTEHRRRVADELAEVARHLEAIDNKIAQYARDVCSTTERNSS